MLKKTTLKVTNDLPWLPPSFRDRKETILFKFKLSKTERKVYRKKKPILVSKWAERNRVMVSGPLEGLKWNNDYFPHLVGILNASFFPSVQYIGNCKAPQTGGSSLMETCIGYAADMKPGPALIVYPDKDTSVKRSMDNLQPMFKMSPNLRKLMTRYQDDMAGVRIKLLTMLIYMGWAGSVTSVGNVSAKYLCLDEVDKYNEYASKKEAAVLDLVLKRVTVYTHGRKVWLTSTPTMVDGVIWNYLQNETQVVFDYWVKCPDCGMFQVMEFDRIKFNGVKDPVEMEAKQPAYYECFDCAGQWNDERRNCAVEKGEWRSREKKRAPRELMKYLTEERPKKICFHTPAWISKLISLSDSAAAFLRGLKSNKALKDFMTQHKAEPWVDFRVDRKLEEIMSLRDDRPQGLVPGDGVVQVLLAAVDTQDHGFWYEIRAWGWGAEKESWQVRSGFVETFNGLSKLLFEKKYQDASGNEYEVRMAAIDAMGHRTVEVYEFCKKYRGRMYPIQGLPKSQYNFTPSQIKRYPGTKRAMPGEVWLYRINTKHYKDHLATKLQICGADPGAWHLNKDVSEGWCRQMTVEFLNDQGAWECPNGRANHAWDVSVYGLFLADFCQLGTRNKPDPNKKTTDKKSRVGKSKFMAR